MADIFATVTGAQSKVVDTFRSLQDPVVGYVRKGVEMADSRLPDIAYPSSLPKPGKVVDSQFNFAKAMLDAQHDLTKALVDTVAPLAGAGKPKSRSTRSTGSSRPGA